ncbi:SRPBCC domain-containing protein [Dyadobacter sp. CY326]|uniref:SRPBCC domain-containing protein n=1 Tax=Dyadobacter sp. CY326 TaxID=2907300 RepID=UPI00286D97EE|nr:SRPBCC domain-containing protein [Dyadobacter sp. CY326]
MLKPYSHIRMSWKKKEWEHDSALQIRVMENGKKTTIAFHHDKLADAEQREEMSEYWSSKMGSIKLP